MDLVINSKYSSLLSQFSIAIFFACTLVACGGGGSGNGENDGLGDGTSGNDNSNVDILPVSEDYVGTAARVYVTQSSLGGVYAADTIFAHMALYYNDSGQEVMACEIGGEKNVNMQKSGPARSLSSGDSMTTTFLQCDEGDGVKEGNYSIVFIEYDEVSNVESRQLLEVVSNGSVDGETKIKNMRIKNEVLGEESVIGINSDRYEIDGSFKGNPRTGQLATPHYEDDKVRISRMVFERYFDDSISVNQLYWDTEAHDKENSDFSYTTTVLDDMRADENGLYSGSYFLIIQGHRIDVTIAGFDNIQVVLDRNNDGTIDEQQQLTNNDFFAAAIIIPEDIHSE
ncbi:MAG: hypothetical protein AB2747_20280 [Candidatus Thiodiazotropha taylori]|nr:hypothetical protein [Candidatus Thiodiazotropha sp. (ex Lucina pensylvanica)]MBT3063570.1 hypothetical protein [Candidatus Thiodiazotropha sp. (ex Lucina pensylvanica)]PUB74082.1 MAG: hypothetical protein DBO99_19010 [gamma proteobacterium symbiont of Ctena orbiculata]PUB75967.1 MAG: hypothetical protein DBP03_05290 [gamma proteobacterium symbiont of Ctena orbiculata]